MSTSETNALAICMQARVPAFLWGEPGIGKTRTIQALAAALDERCWPVILSIREPQDQGGLPVLRPDGSVWMAPPKWAQELVEHGRGVVFLDELNVAPPTTQNSGLRVVNEGWAGDLQLPPSVSFVGAGNPPATNPGAYDLTPAMANRFCHIDWPTDATAWCEGSLTGWPAPAVRRMPGDWEQRVPACAALVVNFIRARPNLLQTRPEDSQQAGRAWASPRSWTTAGRLLAAAEAVGYGIKTREAKLLVQGCVGEGPATEFLKWVVELDLRPVEDYLNDPRETPLPTRQDQLMATLDGVASGALDRSRKDRIRRYKAAWVVVARVAAKAPDLCIPAARILATNMPRELDNDLPEEIDAIAPILKRANIDFSAAR
jgi:hypothetical protein